MSTTWGSTFDQGSTLANRLYGLRCGSCSSGACSSSSSRGDIYGNGRGATRSVVASASYRKRSQFTDDFLARLDRIDTLGGLDEEEDRVGHAGCVNALAWSQSGNMLATGSDDQDIILWRLGTRHVHPSATRTRNVDRSDDRYFPELDMGMSDVIQTGHRANIFSVKWAPNSSDTRLLSCAGDSTVRVFDLTRASSSALSSSALPFEEVRTRAGKEYTRWPRDNGVCTRVLRCHKSRAKRISTENSPDVFLTCAEDGEVRQMDLRLPHTCGPYRGYGNGCPRPLVKYSMELYSLSVSKMEPWLFGVAGTSPQAYLHDRRMVPRLLAEEWGATINQEAMAATQCVRRFARPPYEYSQARQDALEEEERGEQREAGAPAVADEEARREASTRRQRRWERAHITAIKISESNGRDLLASYSGDAVYRFDLKGEPNILQRRETTMQAGSGKKRDRETMRSSVKRKEGPHLPLPPLEKRTPDIGLANRSSKLDRSEVEADDIETLALQRKVVAHLFSNRLRGSTEVDNDDVLLYELDKLERAAEKNFESSGGGLAPEGVVARMCKALICLGGTSSSQDFADERAHEKVETAKMMLGKAQEHTLLRDGFVTLLDQLDDAYCTENTTRVSRVEEALFEAGQDLVKRVWGAGCFQQAEKRPTPEQKMLSPDSDVDEDRDGEEGDAVDDEDAEIEEEEIGEEELSEEADVLQSGTGLPMSRFLRDEFLQGSQGVSSSQESEEGEEEDSSEEMSRDWDDEYSELDPESYGISIERASDEEDEELDGNEGGDEDAGNKAPVVYPVARYAGHANNETVKDCGFLGPNDEHVWSGSDSGHFFVWDNLDERLKALFKGDDCVTNVVQPHPTLPVLAASGIDDTVKLFGPVGPGSRKVADRFNEREEIVRKNRKERRGGAGISSRAIMQLFASHIMREQGGAGAPTRVVNSDGEEEECVVM